MKSGPSIRQSLPAWCGHNLLAGALVGFAAGTVNQLVLVAIEGTVRPVFALAAVCVSAALGALVLLGIGLVTAPLVGSRAGRALAASIHGVAAAVLASLLFGSVALRAFTGAYVTLGAVEFGMTAGQHVLGAALGPFLSWTLSLGLGAVGILCAASWLAFRARGPRVESAALFGAPAALVAAALPAVALEGLSQSSPELAFLASLDESAQSPLSSSGVPQRPVVSEPGPPLGDGAAWARTARLADGQRPNVLVLTLESVAVGHVGFNGYARPTTPNLDRLADRSLRLRRAWTTATHSNYAQMAILSSLFPRRGSGLDTYQDIDYPRVLLHDVFHTLGYVTATITSQDENWQGMLRFQTTHTPTYFWHSPSYRGEHIHAGAELVVPDEATIDHVGQWLGNQGDKSWSLYVNLQVTHFPYKLPPGAPEPFQPTGPLQHGFSYVGWSPEDREVVVNRYDNALAYVDAQVGKLERLLAQRGELEDTLWVITSDHGELFQDHDLVTHGRTLYDAEARVPLLVHWPKKIRAADVYDPVSHIDILPSVLELLGLPPHPAFQGKSFVGSRAEVDDAPGVFMNIQGLRSADALVCWPWKLIADRTGHRVLLFNLEQDPDERDDRAGRDVGIAADMFRILRAQMAAQLAYHKGKNPERERRYAPRMLACPSLPGTPRAEAPQTELERTERAASPPLEPAGRSN